MAANLGDRGGLQRGGARGGSQASLKGVMRPSHTSLGSHSGGHGHSDSMYDLGLNGGGVEAGSGSGPVGGHGAGRGHPGPVPGSVGHTSGPPVGSKRPRDWDRRMHAPLRGMTRGPPRGCVLSCLVLSRLALSALLTPLLFTAL